MPAAMAMDTVTRTMEVPTCPARSGPVNTSQMPVTPSYAQKQTAAHCAKSPNIPTILPPNMDAPQNGDFEAHHIQECRPFLHNLGNDLTGKRTGLASGSPTVETSRLHSSSDRPIRTESEEVEILSVNACPTRLSPVTRQWTLSCPSWMTSSEGLMQRSAFDVPYSFSSEEVPFILQILVHIARRPRPSFVLAVGIMSFLWKSHVIPSRAVIFLSQNCSTCGRLRAAVAESPSSQFVPRPACHAQAEVFQFLGKGGTARELPFWDKTE